MGETQGSEWVVRAYASLYREVSALYRPYSSRMAYAGVKDQEARQHATAVKEMLPPVMLLASPDVLDVLLPMVTALMDAERLRQSGVEYPRLAEETEKVGGQLTTLLDVMRRDLGNAPSELGTPLLVWY